MPRPPLGKLLGIELSEVSSTEKMIAAVGGGLAIFALCTISYWAISDAGAVAIIGSMGASAVLLFAVPHGQLSQPWPVIAGHGFSAVVGVGCARLIPNSYLAAACAVGFAILIMHQCKCIHPPGGATAFTAVAGGPAIHQLGFAYVLFPVLSNALVMVLLAVLINGCFRWRRYPAALNPVKHLPHAAPITHVEVVAAVRTLDSFVDISEEDLIRLVELLSNRETK